MVQVIVSLLVSAAMLGVKSTSLNAAVRTTNRKQELETLITELTRARSSNIPPALFERARRATESMSHEPAEIEMVYVLRPEIASSRETGPDGANAACCSMYLRSLPSDTWRRSFPQVRTYHPPSLSVVQATAVRKLSLASRVPSKPKRLTPPVAASGACANALHDSRPRALHCTLRTYKTCH